MSLYRIPLKAGVPFRLDVAGRLILVDSVGESGGVDLEIMDRDSSKTTKMFQRKAGFRLVQSYAGVILTCAVDATVGIFLSDNDVNLGTVDGAAVKIPDGVRVNSTVADPVFVSLSAPVNIGEVKVNNTNDQAVPVKRQALAVIADVAAVDVTTVAAVISSDPTLRVLRIRNSHATANMAIGGAGVTIAGAAILLQPGDIWIESDAPGAAWYAVSNGPTISAKIQGLK